MARHPVNGNGLSVTTDASIPIQIQRAIRRVEDHVSRLHTTTQAQGEQIAEKVSFSTADLFVMAGHMRDHLQATGSHPLSIMNLPGEAAQPQASDITFSGDLSGTNVDQTVVGIQGRPVAPTAPADTYVLTWVAGDGKWEPMPPTGGSGGGSGTVTSVGLAAPTEFVVTGSPVTTAGTLTLAKASQSANQVWAGPVSGSGVPVFRALVQGDMPAGIGPQVNSDWNAVSGVAQILNKPVIPAAQVNSDWNAVSGVAMILNKPTIPGAVTFAGDLSGTSTSQTVIGLRGKTVSTATPTDGQVLTWVAANNDWEPKPGGSGGGTAVTQEVPTGTINGTNTTFTLSAAPSPASSLLLFLNGVEQLPGTDYTLSGSTITYINAPVAGDWHNAWYGAAPAASVPLVIGFVIGNGATGTNVGPMLAAPHAGTLSKCVVTTKASDGATALTFAIRQNGTSITSPTVAAGTASGTVSTVALSATVAASDVFSIDITSGTATWQFTAQLE
jgi:hypothetical protein